MNGNAARRTERRELDRRRQLARHRRRRCPREQGTGGPTGQREDEPFGKDLPGQAGAAGPKRSADRKLPLTYRRLREQQVRDVDTCDQRHQHDGSLEHQQGRAHRPDTEFVKTSDRRALVVILLVLRRQLATDRFNLCFRRLVVDAVHETGGGRERVRVAEPITIGEVDRNPNRMTILCEAKRRRHHSHDLEWPAVQPHRPGR